MPRRIDPHPLIVLLGLVGLCLLVAGADAGVTEAGMQGWYAVLHHPPGTPPDWLFPVVWVPLYVVMAVAAWRVWRHRPALPGVVVPLRPASGAGQGQAPRQPGSRFLRRRGLQLWGWQLAVNALWTPVFFGLHRPVAALGLITLLALLVGLTLRDFRRTDRLAGLLMAPYLAWVCYAVWLNAGIAWLNQS